MALFKIKVESKTTYDGYVEAESAQEVKDWVEKSINPNEISWDNYNREGSDSLISIVKLDVGEEQASSLE